MPAFEGLPLPKAFRTELFPIDRFDPGGDITALLSKILVTDYQETVFSPEPGGSFSVGLTVAEELVIGLVGLNGFALILGGASATSVTLGAEFRPSGLRVKLGGGMRLRFPREMLKPVMMSSSGWVDDPSRPFAEIAIAAGIVIDQDWNVTFDGANAFTLAPAMVAGSGFVIEGSVALDLSDTTSLPEVQALGLPNSWRGVVFRNLTVHLPSAITTAVPIANIAFENFLIGSGGVSGRIRLAGAPASGTLAGFPFTPSTFSVELKQNALIGVELIGDITLPFFDEPLSVTAGFDLAGNLMLGVHSVDGIGPVTINKPGLLAMTLDSITLRRQSDTFFVSLSGTIRLEVADLEWPTFRVQALTIDDAGHVCVEGGWLALPEQYVLSFYGFQLAIAKIGFGTESDGRRWIGFNGDIKLVEGLPAGASVEGMRVRWSPGGALNPSLSLNGVGVEFEVPGSLSFKGFVAMRQPEPGVYRFDGDIELRLTSLDFVLDGELVVGYDQPADLTFFAIYVGVELPVGIPLWSTGLGLYGLAGLFAFNMEPGRAPAEAWYEMPPGASWYHRDPPGVGVARLRKWADAKGSLGLGAGITLGTVADNGFTFAGRLLIAIVFPGPIILIEGRANVLKSRSNLGDEPVFRTLLVIDNRVGTITAGLDARYLIADGGELIDLHGSLEAFFDFHDAGAWHLYLGIDEPRERRISADVFRRIFRADSYFMIEGQRLRTGAWTGIDKHWSFGPLSVDISAWIDGHADLSLKPAYFQGVMSLHGGYGVSVFGFGFHLDATATLAAGVFDPFFIHADLSVSVSLPWPLPDFHVDFPLEWGPDAKPPLLPATVKEVALGHELVSTTWPLPAESLLLPALDAAPPDSDILPVVPLDARPEITFGCSVHDDALVGVNPQPQYPTGSPAGWAQIGNPASNEGPVLIRPAVTEIRLDRWTDTAWQAVARSGKVPDPSLSAAPPTLYGTWMPTMAPPGDGPGPGQTKLRVWAKTPFSFTRRTISQFWSDWFVSMFPDYPCVDLPRDRWVCCNFSAYASGDRLTPPWTCPDNDAFVVTWTAPPPPIVAAHVLAARDAAVKGLCFAPGSEAKILLLRDVKQVVVRTFIDTARETAAVYVNAYDAGERLLSSTSAKDGAAVVDGRGVDHLVVLAKGDGFCVLEVCALIGLDAGEQAEWKAMSQHTLEELVRWSADDNILSPHTTFRLKLVTELGVRLPPGSKVPDAFAGTRTITQLSYFRTEGPPGLSALAPSGNALIPDAGTGGATAPPSIATGLEDLSRYVRQTIPPTVPPPGQPPILPRPVYRGYDAGVIFGVNYVDLMYALEGRDLSLVLYDMNERPVRDAHGRLAVLPNRWARTDQIDLTDSERRWLEVLDHAHCTTGTVDLRTVARNKTVGATGFVLDPMTTYEARLLPLLAHDTFDGYALGAAASGSRAALTGGIFTWSVLDIGSDGAPSIWRIGESSAPASRYVEETAAVSSGPAARNAPFPGGTLLSLADTFRLASGDPDQPSAWTDYRLAALVRSAGNGIIGLGVRMKGSRGYLMKLDRQRNLRQVVLVYPGSALVLAEAAGGYPLNSDLQISIEAVGANLRVYIDGDLTFDIANSVWASGTAALYAAANAGARFADVRVDDLRTTAPIVYRFKFTTSAFADFRHHVLSGDDRAIATVPADAAPIAIASVLAIDPTNPAARSAPGEPEARAFDAVADGALGPAARQTIGRFEAMRLVTGGKTMALLVRTAEPIDWERTVLATSSADPVPSPVPAKGAKFAEIGFATGAPPDPQHEWATVLLLEDRDLTGLAIERRTVPSPDAGDLPAGTALWTGNFLDADEIGDGTPTLQWQPAFADLSELSFVVPPGEGAPQWSATLGVLSQTGAFMTPDSTPLGHPLEQPSRGTLALGPPLAAADIRLTMNLDMPGNGAAGVVFRYTDAQNYYRFSIDRTSRRRILVRFSGGAFQVLHVSALPPSMATTYAVVVEAVGGRLTVHVDGVLVVSVTDATNVGTSVGFYAQRNSQASFSGVRINRILRTLREWRIDDSSPNGDRGIWRIAYGVLTSDVAQPPAMGESFAVLAAGAWSDLQINATLVPKASGVGEYGLVWRYISPRDHVRLALDLAAATGRLVVRTAGTDAVLWSGSMPPGGPARRVSIKAIGHRLVLSVDGAVLTDIADAGLGKGTAGAFASLTAGIEVAPPEILHAVPTFERWYAFGAEPFLVSGRRVRITASMEPGGYASLAGEEARWKGLAVAGFQPSFPREGVDVRLVDHAGAVLHARRFRSTASYTPLAVRIVRAADGTGFVLVPAGAGSLPTGEIRIEFTFRRDNTTLNQDSLVLRQEGETSPETVAITVA
ncbi:unnamed protein product (plasmid) [Mycetohabitans rhizoxinica HKI 454]|uniref:Concanavalin A-like lectin/glucanase superfamily protein n=1 Tax=Mycetohabitans rhizoxinica (strain DSM 19002 / CIP 109453 / HKI 454) TaxID=882378 RepID=E5AW85_MYCRK|nr:MULTISPECIES: hypothetical protein [Mycetohabitans]MCF7697041.1 hypothetical protein [Mycetohabitans sp. B2]MCG1048766.1 hypothetical protein [Mycetohabitans sp. B6]CBW77387.1 unnamed protein product [Mycetohabitans rhizoxinica HKI 454]